jgi:hypothetical protein
LMFLNDGYLLLESLERYSGVKGNFVPACMGVTQLSSRREGELEACTAMRFPVAVIDGSASFRSWPRSTKVSRISWRMLR